mgnify:CR=1 FL=1|tara:strand:- start:12459 stop:12773 length:315 start_codon:yes stop_codon:yes gene_type:complete
MSQSVDLAGSKARDQRKGRVTSFFSILSILLLGGLAGREVHRYEVDHGEGKSLHQRVEMLEQGQLEMMKKPIFIQVRPVLPIPVPVPVPQKPQAPRGTLTFKGV